MVKKQVEENEESFDLDEVAKRVKEVYEAVYGGDIPFEEDYFESICEEFGDYTLEILELIKIGLQTKNKQALDIFYDTISGKSLSALYRLFTERAADIKKEIYLSSLVPILNVMKDEADKQITEETEVKK